MAPKFSDPLQETDGNIACSLQNPLIAAFKLLQPSTHPWALNLTLNFRIIPRT